MSPVLCVSSYLPLGIMHCKVATVCAGKTAHMHHRTSRQLQSPQLLHTRGLIAQVFLCSGVVGWPGCLTLPRVLLQTVHKAHMLRTEVKLH